jgi:hypothetical protein
MSDTAQLGQFPVTRARTDLDAALAADIKPHGIVQFIFSDEGLVFDWYGTIDGSNLQVCADLLLAAHERLTSTDHCTFSGFADEPHGGPVCNAPGEHKQICPLCQAPIIRCEAHGGQIGAARALAKHLLQAHPAPPEPKAKKSGK